MKLLHLDDHVLFAEGLSAVLQQRVSDLTIFSANETEHAFMLLEEHSDIDLVLVDLSLPGMDGFAFLEGMEQRGLYIPVAVLSATDDLWKIKKVFQAGVSGFIPKTYGTEKILDALGRIAKGEIVVPDDIQQGLQELPETEPTQDRQKILAAYQLGQRQFDVLKLMQQGYSNEEIGSVLGLSKNTIKTHARTLFTSFQVSSRLECVRYAERIGLLS